MIRLLYFSQAIPTIERGDLENILEAARRKNGESGITGVLVTGGKVFLQILEGPTQPVLSLYLKLLEDKRHTEVELVRATRITHRLFDEWSMGFFETTPLQFEQVLQFKREYFPDGEPREYLAALRGLINILRE
jgi:hypothetical protein